MKGESGMMRPRLHRSGSAAGRNQGQALSVLLAVITVVLAVGAGVIHAQTSAERTARLELQAESAFYAAEAGLQQILAWTRAADDRQFNWAQTAGQPLVGEVQACLGGTCAGAGATYTVTWAVVSVGSPATTQLHVVATGRAGPARREIRAKVEYNDKQARVVCYQCP